MPIYAYRCESCGHAKDVLQKMSDPLLTVCPSCGEPTFKKQVTAAGFQLKGSGWYVTDFREGNQGAKSGDKATEAPSAKADAAAKPASGESSSPAPAPAPSAAPAASPPPAPSGGGSAGAA